MESTKTVLMSLFMGRKKDADVENGPLDTVGKKKVGQPNRVALTYIHYREQTCQLMGAAKEHGEPSPAADDLVGWDREGVVGGRLNKVSGCICTYRWFFRRIGRNTTLQSTTLQWNKKIFVINSMIQGRTTALIQFVKTDKTIVKIF